MRAVGRSWRAALTALEPAGRPRTMRDAGAGVESLWTNVGGLRVHARVALDAAPTDARDLVLVHGLVVSSRYMVPLALELARDFRVLAPDLPGFGLSDAPAEPLDVAGLAEALLAWIDRRGIGRPVLVANSFGCQVAVEALARRPQRFERAVLQGPVFDPEVAGAVGHALRWTRTGLREPLALNAIIARDWAGCGPSRALATARAALPYPLEERLGGVEVPTLVVRGGADAVTSQRWAERVTAALPRGDLIVLPNAAHALPFSAAPQLGAVVRRFAGARARRRPGRPRSPARSIASFDSATAMLRASSRALKQRGMAGLGAVPRPVAPLAERLVAAANLLPRQTREEVYRRGSGAEGVPPQQLHRISAEATGRWMAACHPRGRRYPAAIVGSSSGAIAHLAAALAVPFLPQTVLVPVRQPDVHPDDPRHGLEAGRGPAHLLLDANPELQLHHMHDPNQDRLTLARMAYFRVKRLRLGDALERFLSESLAPGATLFVADCTLRWPVTRVGERHIFQLGALGGMDADEFHRRWDAADPDHRAPEAEWGFEPALLEDLRALAQRRRLRLRRIVFEDPEDPSPQIADLHRWWYHRRGFPAGRLLVESFVLLDPWWAIRTHSVPLWLKFAVEPSAARLERYLAGAPAHDDVRLALFSHGTEGVGIAPADRWQEILRRGPGAGAFLGVDEQRFPRDFASFGRFGRELRGLDDRRQPPAPLTLAELDEFLATRGRDDPVEWLED
jgi:pimeloyl-ACP methyl ester carboxylesterase